MIMFEYDALGRRIEKVDAIEGTTTRYYYDEQRAAVQTLVSGCVESDVRYYVFGSYIDEVLMMHDGTGDLYYAHDHLYSPVALLAANGAVVERCEYDVYGKVHILAPNYELRTASLYGNPYTFTGRELDTLDNNTLHLYYYRARTYNPHTGRFMQRDPLGIDPSESKENRFFPLRQYENVINLYQYVKVNPVNYIDPYGKSIQNVIDGVAKFFGCGIFIYCRNNEIMPWPFKYTDHCHPVIGPFDDYYGGPDMTKPDAKVYPVAVIQSGIIQYGPATGKPCKCATCGDIRACVAKGRNIGYHGIWPYLRGRNCQGAAAKAIMGCCLRSTWRPSAPISELEPGYEPISSSDSKSRSHSGNRPLLSLEMSEVVI